MWERNKRTKTENNIFSLDFTVNIFHDDNLYNFVENAECRDERSDE